MRHDEHHRFWHLRARRPEPEATGFVRCSTDLRPFEHHTGDRKPFLGIAQPPSDAHIALNNKALPGFVIRFQVRNGLGAMPAFGPDLISSEELDAVVAYLVTLRRHGD